MPVRKSQSRASSPADVEDFVAPSTVSQAASSGTTRDLLVAMRTRIAMAVEDADTPPRDLAALTKRLVEVVRDIEAIDAREEEVGAHAEVSDGKFDPAKV